MLGRIKGRLFGRKNRRSTKNGRPVARSLRFEACEGRVMMAVHAFSTAINTEPLQTVEPSAGVPAAVAVVNGDLYINAAQPAYTYTPPNDVARVDLVNGQYKVTQNGLITTIPASDVYGGDVIYTGYSGNDTFYNYTDLRLTGYGMGGNDSLYGSSGNDTLYGGEGDDLLYGGTGSDSLIGDGGNDLIQAGYDYSYNYVDAGSGNDTVYGGWGTDKIFGGSGYDLLYGDAGNDSLYGGDHNDTLYGGLGDDYLQGNAANDYLFGDAGNDTLFGNSGDDWLFGGDDNDDLNGDIGRDHLYGEYGDDDLDGGYDGEYDDVYGGAGNDRFRRDPLRAPWWNPVYHFGHYTSPSSAGYNQIHDLEVGEEIYG